MNETALKIEMLKHNYTVPSLAKEIGIGKKAFYAKMRGDSQFKQVEIKGIKTALSLTDEQTTEIFFTD